MTIQTFVRTAVVFSSVIVSAGCSNGDSGNPTGGAGGGSGCTAQSCPFDYSTFAGDAPVSFQNDIMGDKGSGPGGNGGIFRRACAFNTTCHGATAGGKASIYVAPGLFQGTADYAITATDIDTVLNNPMTGLIGIPSKTYPTMMRVQPGDPENSFLMRKIDGCLGDLDQAACQLQPGSPMGTPRCGNRMPQAVSGDALTLCPDERDIIRRWIKQGARGDI